MDQEVSEQVEKTKTEFQETYKQVLKHIHSIQEYRKKTPLTSNEIDNKVSLQRLNGLAQDGIKLLQSLQFNLDLLAPQLSSVDHVENAESLVQSWNNHIQSLKQSLRNANLQAKENIKKAAQQERAIIGRWRRIYSSKAQFADKSRNDFCC